MLFSAGLEMYPSAGINPAAVAAAAAARHPVSGYLCISIHNRARRQSTATCIITRALMAALNVHHDLCNLKKHSLQFVRSDLTLSTIVLVNKRQHNLKHFCNFKVMLKTFVSFFTTIILKTMLFWIVFFYENCL